MMTNNKKWMNYDILENSFDEKKITKGKKNISKKQI